MKIFSRESIPEGSYYPEAWLWIGKVIPLHGSAPIGSAFMLRLPWWTRQETRNGQAETCQLVFEISQYEGPEDYRFFWLYPND